MIRQPAHQPLFHTTITIVTGIAGIGILAAYLVYLNITPHPMLVDPATPLWFQLPKIIICLFLWGVIFQQLPIHKQHFEYRKFHVTRKAAKRSLLAGIVFSLSIITFAPPDVELAYYFLINSVAYGMIFYAFFSIAGTEYVCESAGKVVLRLLKLPALFWLVPALIFLFAIAHHYSWVLFQYFPWLHDTIAQFVHSKFIAQGHWYGQSPPLFPYFQMAWVVNDGKWYSQYPPGHEMILGIGMALKHPEMVNPVLGACHCVAVWLLAREIYGAHVAKIAVLLTALCTYLIMLYSEYMNNATSVLMSTLFLWAYFCVLHQRGLRYAFIAGMTLGYCFITRPYAAVALAIPAALYGFFLMIVNASAYRKPMLLIGVLVSCFLAFQLYYNHITTGNIFYYAYQKVHGGKTVPFNHTSLKRLNLKRIYLNIRLGLQRMSYFNRMLFEWPLPALGLVAFLYSVRGNRRDERLLFFTILSMYISIHCVLNKDFILGPRLISEITGVLLIFCAKALSMLPPYIRKLSSRRHSLSYYYGGGLLILASFYAFSFQYNLKNTTLWGFYYANDREGNPEFYKSIVKQVTPPALVFVPGEVYKFVSFTNPPEPVNPIVFAINFYGEKNLPLINMYPDRNKYYVKVNKSGQPEVHSIPLQQISKNSKGVKGPDKDSMDNNDAKDFNSIDLDPKDPDDFDDPKDSPHQ